MSRNPWRVLGLSFCLLAAVYLFTGKGFSDLQDAETYYLTTQSLVENGTVALPTEGALVPAALDAVHAAPGSDGRLYPVFGLGYPIFQIPAYLLGKAGGSLARRAGLPSSLVNMLPRAVINLSLALQTAATATVLCALLGLLTGRPRLAAATALLYGLGSAAWPYSKAGFYEPFLALCLLVCFLCLVVYAWRRPHGLWLVAAGCALGWGAATKPSILLAAPFLLAYVLHRRLRPTPEQVGFRAPLWREAGWFLLGLLPWVAVMLVYNHARSGSYLNPGFLRRDYAPNFSPGFYLPQLYAYLIGPGRGALTYCPLILLSLIGWRAAVRRHPAEMWTAVLIFAAYLLYHAAAGPDVFSWGPRYLLPGLAVVMLPAPWGIERLRRSRPGRVGLALLVAVGGLIQVLAVVAPYPTWMGEVMAETGSSQAVIYQWRYFPPAGQLRVLAEVETTPLQPASGGGFVSADYKAHLRHSLDFWWFYAWRMNLPLRLVLPGMALLLAAVAACGLALSRALRTKTSPRKCSDE
ncbi:MAG TPA: hypothetical protein VGM19_07070 [Armatimonadota bacterium]